jgi:hypothetical protein
VQTIVTTYNATTSAELEGYLLGGGSYPSSYEDGDIINVSAGTFTLSQDVVPAAGRLAGVTIQGAGKNSTIINPAEWEIVANGRLNIKDIWIKLDGEGLTSYGYGSMDLADGTYELERVKITSNGANTGNAITFVANLASCIGFMWQCDVTGPQRDCVSTKAPGGQALARKSTLSVVECYLSDQGVNSNDQCVTSHDEFPIFVYGGVLKSSSADRAAAAQDFAYSRLFLWATGVPVGTVRVLVQGRWWQPAGWQSRN